jgi:DNA (cytosine-5)-methyltransferase 1
VLDAQYFGVPQRRRRIFLVASLGNGDCAKVLFERESLPGTLRTRPEKWQSATVAGTITASASGTARTGGNANQIDLLVFGKQRSNKFQESASVASTLAARDGKDFGDLLAFSPATYKRGFEKNHLHEMRVAATLRAKNNKGSTDTEEHVVQHGLIRRLTPLECERLQGFPDNWTVGFADSIRYTIMGNSIAVPVVTWIFQNLAAVEAQRQLSLFAEAA